MLVTGASDVSLLLLAQEAYSMYHTVRPNRPSRCICNDEMYVWYVNSYIRTYIPCNRVSAGVFKLT